ncbi:MAG TPA: sugar ABC transporter permease [Acetobacteraceae bacterium]|nr:sugar ABC transporter permease [Acetobacteraceae bacterium]
MSSVVGDVGDAAVRRIPRRLSAGRRLRRVLADYAYIAPALGVMLLVIGYPIYDTIYLSFFNTPPSMSLARKTFAGVDNYTRILTSDAFWAITWNTVLWTVFSTLISFVLGFCAALALNREFLGRGLLRGLLLVPYVISAVAAAFVWRWLYHSDFGVIGAMSVQLGITDKPIIFLDNVDTVLPSLIVVNIWKEFPFAMIMVLAGLQTVPDQLLRAARVDGAGTWQSFWQVTFPHLRSVSTITVLLLVVTSINSFTIPWIMTGGGPAGSSHIWITAIYELAFGRLRFGPAAAYSVILFLILMCLGYFYVRALTSGDNRRRGEG